MNILVKILIGITTGVLIIHFLFAWMVTNVDTSYFHAFANYIRTGVYEHFMLYEYKKPLTNNAPLYSVLLASVYAFPSSDILLHAVQLAMLVHTGYMVFRMLLRYTGKSLAIISGSITILIPGNLAYASHIMSEITMQYFFTSYMYLLWENVHTKKTSYLTQAVFMGFAMGLVRYSYIICGPLALAYLLRTHRKIDKTYIFPAVGIVVILVWMLVHKGITGVFGLSDFSRLRYNMVMMYEAQVSPPEADPSTIELHSFLPEGFDLRKPFWEFEPYINPITGNDFQELDRIVGSAGIAALRSHPEKLITIAFYNFFKLHNVDYPHQTPYSPSLADFGNPDAEFPNYCTTFKTLRTCEPIISLPFSVPVWNSIFILFNWFYRFIFPIWSIWIFFPALFYSLAKNRKTRLLALFYIAARIPIAVFTFPHARYLVPFYPVMMMMTMLFLSDAVRLFRNTYTSFSIRP